MHLHVLPVRDLIEHDSENQEDCVCAPRVERHDSPTGDAWLYVHHSLDGREEREHVGR